MSGGIVVFLITAVALPLLLTEFGDWCPWLAARIVRWAARHLGDPASCERYEEEWIANLNEVPGKLARLVAAFGYLAYTPSMRRSVRRRAARSLSSPAPARLRLLPVPEAGDFVGRERELDALRNHLRAATGGTADRRLIYIVGMAGIGKTALATSLAHRMKEDFPDGVLFMPVWSRAGRLGDCLDELLMAVGASPSRIPSGEADKSALFRACVSGLRILLVLDDIEDPDQVDALFRGDLPCPVLVTSRRLPLQPPSAKILTLSGLDNDEARSLLRSRLGRRVDTEAQDAARLVSILDGLPLAISVVAAVLAGDPSRTIADVLLELEMVVTGGVFRPGDSLREDVRTALGALYYRLPGEERALLRRLSLLPDAPFGKNEAALLISTTPGDADRVIKNLASLAWLANATGGAGRYVLHDLVRACAQEFLQHDEAPEHIQALRDHLTRHGLNPPNP